MMDHCPLNDFTLLDTKQGCLLVSPQNGTYCAIHPDERDEISAWILDSAHSLSAALKQRLQEHGFFDGPRPWREPYHLTQIQVTNACNLHCVYCSADSGCARGNELTLDDIKHIIDESTELYPDGDISFTGGEPLIVPWILDAIDDAMSKSKRVGILSNLLLTHDNNDLLQALVERMKNGLNVQMSISGADRAVCDRLSGVPCYDRALDVIHRFADKGQLPKLDLMLSAPDAQANIDAFAAFRRALPEDIEISIGLLYPCGRENGEHIFLSRDEAEQMLDDITFEGGVSIPAQRTETKTFRRQACTCVEHENIYIRSDGYIYSCFKMVESFGHIRDGLKSVIENRRKQAVKAIQLPLCHDCPFVYLCASGCRADNIIITGNTKAPICGTWRKELIAEMLYENKTCIFDWTVIQQWTEARKRGIKTPEFLITSLRNI